MFGAMKYIVIILFLVFIFNSFLDRYAKTKLDGTWYNENPNAIIHSIKINVNGSSYLLLNQKFADKENLPRYYTLSYILSSPGGFLSSLAYFDENKLKSDIFINIIPLSKREIIIAEVNSLKICNPQKCFTLEDIRENKFINKSSILSIITDLFI
jgi:hypothetical protein